MATPEIVSAHRETQSSITALVERDLTVAWSQIDVADAIAARDAMLEVVPALVETYGEVAGVAAADFYDEMRLSQGASGSFLADPSAPPPRAAVEANVRWGLSPLFGASPDGIAALSLLVGSAQRSVLAADRNTVRDNVANDKAATGWQRYSRADACGFCRMLAGRQERYSKDTARFASHDFCHCTAAPTWMRGEGLKVQQFVATKRRITPQQKEDLRKYVAKNYPAAA